ncbi:MAG: DUF1385 domain-containing protein, partial [Polyangiaceae bacterium]
VRRRDGSLQVRERAMPVRARDVFAWPLVRGIASLVESLRLGSEALRFSAERMEEDFALEEAEQAAAAGPGLGVLSALGLSLFAWVTSDAAGAPVKTIDPPPEKKRGGGSWVMLVVAVAFFVALPQAAAAGIDRLFKLGLSVQGAPFQAVTGAFKLAIILGYLLAIRRVPEIRRVFQYHGAEHKTISTYEAGEELSVIHARAKTTLHPRCGTTFLVMVALVSILLFVAIGAALPRIHTGNVILDNVCFFVEKLPFLPLLVAVTFELQRVLSRYCTAGPLRVLLVPGFLVQKITTAEPDDAQLEVALASLRVTLFRQERGEQPGERVERAVQNGTFSSYEALVVSGGLRPAA